MHFATRVYNHNTMLYCTILYCTVYTFVYDSNSSYRHNCSNCSYSSLWIGFIRYMGNWIADRWIGRGNITVIDSCISNLSTLHQSLSLSCTILSSVSVCVCVSVCESVCCMYSHPILCVESNTFPQEHDF